MNWIDLITNVTGLAAAVISLVAAWTQQRPGGDQQRHRESPTAPPSDD